MNIYNRIKEYRKIKEIRQHNQCVKVRHVEVEIINSCNAMNFTKKEWKMLIQRLKRQARHVDDDGKVYYL